MKSKRVIPNNLGWIQSKLDKEHLDFLWEMIEKSSKKDYKDRLAGNIKQSFEIEDEGDYFFNEILFPHSQMYYNTYGGHPIRDHSYGDIELRERRENVNKRLEKLERGGPLEERVTIIENVLRKVDFICFDKIAEMEESVWKNK